MKPFFPLLLVSVLTGVVSAEEPRPVVGGYLFAHMTKTDYGRLYYEQYPGISYDCSTAPKLAGPWYNLYGMKVEVPAEARHGCMIPITKEQLAKITAAFGAKKQ